MVTTRGTFQESFETEPMPRLSKCINHPGQSLGIGIDKTTRNRRKIPIPKPNCVCNLIVLFEILPLSQLLTSVLFGQGLQLFCCFHISLTILSYTLGLSQKSITASSHAIEKPIPIHMSPGQKLCESLEGFTRPSCLCRHQFIPHHTAHSQVYS